MSVDLGLGEFFPLSLEFSTSSSGSGCFVKEQWVDIRNDVSHITEFL